MNIVRRFGNFLETRGPDAGQRIRGLHLDAKQLRELENKFQPLALVDLGTRRRDIERHLGKPDVDQGDRIGYDLHLHDLMRFFFDFKDDFGLVRSGYELRPGLPNPLGRDREAISMADLVLHIGQVTRSEIENLVGQANEVVGWWPVETHIYHHMRLEYRLDILQKVSSVENVGLTSG